MSLHLPIQQPYRAVQEPDRSDQKLGEKLRSRKPLVWFLTKIHYSFCMKEIILICCSPFIQVLIYFKLFKLNFVVPHGSCGR